jgi:mono/diheme cytochrome c family protein
MSAPSQPTPSEATEPRVGSASVPVWLIILLFVLLYWGMVYFDLQGAWFEPNVYAPYHSAAEVEFFQPPPPEGPNLAQGKAKFELVCGVCHGTDGLGKPNSAPPYIGSEWVQGSPNRLIRIPQQGLNGPIHVNGQSWAQVSSMAAMGAGLSDEDLANVLSYIRATWGNKAPAITPEQVHKVRGDSASHPQPWTEPELLALPKE